MSTILTFVISEKWNQNSRACVRARSLLIFKPRRLTQIFKLATNLNFFFLTRCNWNQAYLWLPVWGPWVIGSLSHWILEFLLWHPCPLVRFLKWQKACYFWLLLFGLPLSLTLKKSYVELKAVPVISAHCPSFRLLRISLQFIAHTTLRSDSLSSSFHFFFSKLSTFNTFNHSKQQ